MSMSQEEIYGQGRNEWVLNSNFQSQLEYGHTEKDAMVNPKQHMVYADSPIPRMPSCLEDVWQYPETDPMIKMPGKINKKG